MSGIFARGLKGKAQRRARAGHVTSTRSLHMLIEAGHQQPAPPDLIVGNIYECYASLKDIIAQGVSSHFRTVVPLSGLQSSYMSNVSRSPPTNARPCLISDLFAFGGMPRFVALCTLEEFQPLFLCCNMQHFLISINDTPAWPTSDAFRLDIKPWWPRLTDQSTQHYALAVRVPVAGYEFKALCTYLDDEGIARPYQVTKECLGFFGHVCDMLQTGYISLSPEDQKLYEFSFNLGQVFYARVKELHKAAKDAGRRWTPDELAELEQLFNAHMRATNAAKRRPTSAWVPMTATDLPKAYRSSFPDGLSALVSLPAYHDHFEAVDISPSMKVTQFSQLLSFIIGLHDKTPTDDVLADVLREVVKTVKDPATPVNRAFAELYKVQAIEYVHRDPGLADALRSLCSAVGRALEGTLDDVDRLRNYICYSD